MLRHKPLSWVRLFAIAMLCGSGAGSAAEYSTESRIIDQAGLPNGSPVVIVDSQGNATALWEQSLNLGDARSVWSNYYLAKSDTWGKARVPLTPDHRLYSAYRLAIDPADNVFVLASNEDGADVYRFNAAAASWGKASTIDSGKTTRFDGALAFGPRGDGLAVWAKQDNSSVAHVELWGSRFTAAREAWSAPELVSAPAEWVGNPSAQFDNQGNAFVTWSERNTKVVGGEESSTGAIRVRRFANGAWETTIPSFAEYGQSGISDLLRPYLAVSGNGAALLMWSPHGHITVTSYRRGKPGAGAWTAPVDVDGDKDARRASISMSTDDQGNALIAWIHEAAGQHPSVVVNRFNAAPKEGGWGKTPALVREITGETATSTSVVIDAAGNGFVAWDEDGPDNCSRVFVNSHTAAGWGAATAIVASSTASADDPALGIGKNGTVMLVWREATWKSPATRWDDERYIKARRLR